MTNDLRTVEASQGASITCVGQWMLALVIGILGILAPVAAAAQSGTTATVSGVVKDPAGAVIPAAQVSITNTADGITTNTKSNGSGMFIFSGLQSGDYRISVAHQGFKKFQESGIHLDPGDSRQIRDIQMSLGEASEEVVVTATTGGVELDSGEVSSTISAGEIQDLTLEGRDVTELLKILPGMAISSGSTYTVSTNIAVDPSQVVIGGGMGNFVANGTLKNGTSLLLDGADITSPVAWGTAVQNVNGDMVAQVKVTSGSFPADTAKGPVVINSIGKSGTDHFHGSVYAYGRTYQLNSVDSLAKQYGQSPYLTDRQIYPGFTFGGPVRLPFTNWNHNSRLTFFVGAEAYQQRNSFAYGNVAYAYINALVPTANMRKGIFTQSEIQNYLGNEYQTSSGNCTGSFANLCPVPTVGPTGQAITNGDISSYLDPTALAYMNQIVPLPNKSSSGGYNYTAPAFVDNNLWQMRERVDYALSRSTKVFASYGYEKGVIYLTQNNGGFTSGSLGGLTYPGGPEQEVQPSHVLSLNVNSVLGSTLTNAFWASAVHAATPTTMRHPSLIEGNTNQYFFTNPSTVLPQLSDSGHNSLPELPIQDVYYGPQHTNVQGRSAGDDVTKLLGHHVLKAGIFYQWGDIPAYSVSATNGSITSSYVNGTFTDPVTGTTYYPTGSGSNSATGENSLANFMEGVLGNFSQTNYQVHYNLYYWNFSGYLEDHWRASDRLTLEAGLRIEHFTPWRDAEGVGLAVFDPASYAKDFPVNSPGVVYHAIDPSIPLAGIGTATAYFDPRGGFAWNPYRAGATVIRGGAGIYHQHDSYNDVSAAETTSLGQRSYSSSSVSNGVTLPTVHDYASSVQTAGSAFVRDSSITTLNPKDNKVPTLLTFNFEVDQNLPHNQAIQIAYVGNMTFHLLNNQNGLGNINALPFGALWGPMPNTRPDAQKGNAVAGYQFPFFAPSGSNTYSFQNITQAMVDSYRPYPLYNSIKAYQHTTSANYNGLQARYRLMLGSRANVGANLTWGKALGNYWGQDPLDLSQDYMPLLLDRRILFSSYYSYRWGRLVANRFVGAITNGWLISGVTSHQTGVSMPATYGTYTYGLNAKVVVPQGTTATIPSGTSSCLSATCTVSLSSQLLVGTPDVGLMPRYTASPAGVKKYQYVNPNVIALPTIQNNGPYKVPAVYGPGYFDSDLTLAKEFAVGEGRVLQFRAAAFNFLNRANPTFTSLNSNAYTLTYNVTAPAAGDVNSLIGSVPASQNSNISEFGSTISTKGVPQKIGRRVVELGAKFTF